MSSDEATPSRILFMHLAALSAVCVHVTRHLALNITHGHLAGN